MKKNLFIIFFAAVFTVNLIVSNISNEKIPKDQDCGCGKPKKPK